ncbi:sensor histidine kinase [Streptomyces sp. NPDC053048]|uniref:sensor histidine kinase n=1 Tax=Streptomyces sp. NPDC053048 TaxID=3365694 RepID=UPI0037D7AEC7
MDTHETNGGGLRSEMRIARSALEGIRRDLFTDPFAFRPLPPLGGRGRYTRWLPHAAVVMLTNLVMLGSLAYEPSPAGVLLALFVGAPLLMTLFRPVGAWWLSMGSLFVTGVVTGAAPWTPTGLVSHMAVMVIVTIRTRPRMAAWMWLLTAACGVFLGILRGSGYDTGTLELTVMAGMVLVAVAAVRGLTESRQQVAAQAAVTEEERSRRTVLEERTTIARELHDVVAHHMSVVAIQAEAAPYRVQDTPPELAAAFQTIRENAVAALTELRRVLGVVRSENPDAFADPEAPQPTLAALPALIENVRSAGLAVEHVTTGAVRPLPQGVELSAYRIVQEALSNVLRHAPGAHARVEVSYVLGGLGLRVVNGRPDRLAKPSPGAGHGVLGMRERVGMLGGGMTAQATDDGGYEVAAFLPVGAPGEAAA